MLTILPAVFALVTWALLFLVISSPQAVLWVIGGLFTAWLVSLILFGRKKLTATWRSWAVLVLYLLGALGITLILSSAVLRNTFVIASGFLAGGLTYLVVLYVRRSDTMLGKRYLDFMSFMYLVTFWQATSFLFFMVVAYDEPLWSLLVIILPLTYLVGSGVLAARALEVRGRIISLAVAVVTVAEVSYVVELLPVHYFVLAALVTIWLAFILEVGSRRWELSKQGKVFTIYTLLAFAAMALLLGSARWGS